MFNWIRTKVRNAVLAGVADAVEVLQKQGGDDIGEDAEGVLEERIRLLPAPAQTPAASRPGRGRTAQ